MLAAHGMLTDRRNESFEEQITLSGIEAVEDGGLLKVRLPGMSELATPTHHAFSQLSNLMHAPSKWLRRLPNQMCANDLKFGFNTGDIEDKDKLQKALVTRTDKGLMLRAITGKDYGRIWDSQVSGPIMEMADKHGLTVPIAFRRPDLKQNPVVQQDVDKASTTIYAGDQGCFFFLVDQNRAIQAGTLADGSPRYFFRGFYCWNSECGTKMVVIGTFLYEFVCCNRMIWNQAGFEQIATRHTKYGPERYFASMIPALRSFIEGSATGVEQGLIAAQQAKLPQDEEVTLDWLQKATDYAIGIDDGRAVLASILAEEGRKAESIFDLFQGITATARDIPFTEERLAREAVGSALLDRFMN
jgi:hypothetical protein